MTDTALGAFKAALLNPNEALLKSWLQSTTATSGITAYDLEGPAKLLFPVMAPLRNRIPRVSGKGGIQANWRAITGINTGNLAAGVSQGNRGGVISSTTKDYIAAYRGIGLEDYVTFEAEYAAEGYDDMRRVAQMGLLDALMIKEEQMIVGGNNSTQLTTTAMAAPSVAASSIGGSLTAATIPTLSVIVVPLTTDGLINAGGPGMANGYTTNGFTLANATVQGQITRTNADGSTDTYGGGSGWKSTNGTAALSGTTASATATCAIVRGAAGYAWFWGVAGSEYLGSITTTNSVAITAAATGTQLASSLPASDNSTNSLGYDGLLTMCANSSNNAYYQSLATGTAGTGSTLTADGAGGVVELDTALRYFWDNYRLSPTSIQVSSQEQLNITKKILGNGSSGSQRFTIAVEQGKITGGDLVTQYLNKFAMNGAQKTLPIELHPNMPAGTILFMTDKLPYKLNDVTNVLQIRTRQEYYSIEWPRKSRKYEYGVYADEVLQNYFPPAFGVINNIGNG